MQPLKILFLSAEVAPFAKAGGLADAIRLEGPNGEPGERVLDPRHFEFRHGAIPRKPPGAGRRASDPPIAGG